MEYTIQAVNHGSNYVPNPETIALRITEHSKTDIDRFFVPGFEPETPHDEISGIDQRYRVRNPTKYILLNGKPLTAIEAMEMLSMWEAKLKGVTIQIKNPAGRHLSAQKKLIKIRENLVKKILELSVAVETQMEDL